MSDNPVLLRLQIDPMRPDDLPAILAIETEAFPVPWTRRLFEEELENDSKQCFCARSIQDREELLTGYIIFGFVVDEVHLHKLAVKKAYRRRGVAFRLMETMKALALERGMSAITLEVRRTNIEALNLYRKCGFIVKGIRRNYYAETQEDALILWKDI